jgi:hypothetical protein
LEHLALFAKAEPTILYEALKNKTESMKEEMQPIEKNYTWNLVQLPSNKKTIDVRWVFKVKEGLNDEVMKYNARLLVRDFFLL